jgi:hypothetical protein
LDADAKHAENADDGMGIHWSDLDEDVSIEHLLAGIPSGESQPSLENRLSGRNKETEE